MTEVVRPLCHVATFVAAVVLASACGQESPERLLESAKRYIANQDHRAAAIQLKNALQKDPKSPEVRLLLGTALLESGDPVGAEIEIRKAIEFGLPIERANPALARAMLLSGKLKPVIDQFSGATTVSPSDAAELQATIAQAHILLRSLEPAESAVQRALAADPKNASALYISALIKAERKDMSGASDTIDAALKSSPRFADALLFKGQLLASQGDVDGALASYRAALRVKPYLIAANVAVIELLIGQDKFEEARQHLDAFQTAAPKHAAPSLLRATLHYREKNLAAAQESIEQHLSLLPDSVHGLLLAARINQDLRLFARAEANVQRVLAQSPNHPLARRLLVAGRLGAGEPRRALEVLPAMLQVAGQDPAALSLAGQVYLANGQRDAATRHFEQAAALDPKNDRTRMNVALSRFAQGDRERAIQELQQAASDSTDVDADIALITAHLRKGEADKALAAVAGLDKKRPNHALPHHVRGVVLLYKKDTPAARASFERALSIDAAYVPSAMYLARLDIIDTKPQEANRRFERVLAKNPKSAQALLAMAEIERLSGATADTVGALIGKAVAAAPTDVSARVTLIDHHLRNKDPARAVAAAQDALAAVRDRPAILEASARAYIAAGASKQALGVYSQWVQLQPNAPLPLVRIAEIHLNDKDYAAAERNLKRALELRPNFVEAQRRLIALEISRNRLPAAVAIAQVVQKQRPKEPIGFVLEGDIHASRKAWKPAIAAYTAGLKQAPSPDLAIKAHAAQRLVGQRNEADKLASDWLAKHPDDRAFRLYLAESSLKLREYAVAAEQYKALVAQQPDNVTWLNDLAWTLGQLKDPKAIEHAEKAAAMAPGNAAVLDTLGVLLVDAGQTERGISLLRKATSLAPDRHSIRLNLAGALIRAGDKQAARKELESLAKFGDKFAGQDRVAELMKQL